MDAGCVAIAFLMSAAATAGAIAYAHRRQMLDLPGQRRSHSVPTPRGGGIGIVLAAVVVLALAPPPADVSVAPAIAALALVGGIGWWDDHRPLRALWRFLVHCVAGLLVAWPLVHLAATGVSAGYLDVLGAVLVAGVAAAAVLSVVWSINLHNFIDGINGLLSLQAAWMFAMVGVIDRVFFDAGLAWLPWSLAAACLGFVPFNFPRARVFMGDVGSGAIGFLVAATIWLATGSGEPRWLALGLILASAPAIDATATLLGRMLAGRRWYSAHREHLYQWLVRSGRSHARVVGYYMVWNLFIAAPASLCVARSPRLDVAAGVTALVYAIGYVVWRTSRRAVLRGVRRHD